MTSPYSKYRLSPTALVNDFMQNGNWHLVRVELERHERSHPGNDQVLQPFAAPYLDWAIERKIGHRHDYSYELVDDHYKSYLDMWFPPEKADQAMLFKLTFAGV